MLRQASHATRRGRGVGMDAVATAGGAGSGSADATLSEPPAQPIPRTQKRAAQKGKPQFIDVFQQLINGLPEQIALLDEHWNILAVNEAWTRTAALYNYSTLRPGTNYLEFCRDRADEGHNAARPAVEGIMRIEAGDFDSFRYVYDGNDRWEGHTFQLCINRLEIAGRILATVTRYDVTELVHLRRQREGFGHSLMEGQAEERRRIAREIHDSTLQLLTGLGLAVGQLKRTQGSGETLNIVADMEQLLTETYREIRSISYLAHPPLLEEMGLTAALQALVEGFGRRTGLAVALHIEQGDGANWQSAEVVLYRFVQEALSNVHHHAHATKVEVGLFARRSIFHAVVSDDGLGMPLHVSRGVGLAGMRERLAELGGRLTVRPGRPGARLIASVPADSRIRATGDLALRV